ncbi:hypothetical protein [Rhizobium laguerreae]|uniref:hypothetical protein n=1 Tax=Rhizobium laguerreae TaxID=1076926 RepID=UPI0010398E6B|nr:hypothetical protein [Rhizobium laguerreae]MBY3082439.1 hypothetical protein [Rhizobium laguerreae]MBY3116364.1 hypothetical protein [Rhizobium laguerreae]MBY3199525.1 hypothetical protein [Rhizobium laguerreae]MBY3230839.1 hypothetical protein [Rhizobium laguerreae]MBY3280509.1 hypothetical protein [Rhizobium laguerreae]
MPAVSPTPIMPPDEHITAREALEPLYERLALHTDATLLSAAIEAGWPANEATKAVAALRLQDALNILRQVNCGPSISMQGATAK